MSDHLTYLDFNLAIEVVAVTVPVSDMPVQYGTLTTLQHQLRQDRYHIFHSVCLVGIGFPILDFEW